MLHSRFEEDRVYMLEGRRLQTLESISAMLIDASVLTRNARRDAADMIDLILSEAANQKVGK